MSHTRHCSTQLFSAVLFTLLFNPAFAADDLAAIEQKFIGNWELVTYFTFPAQGDAREMNYTGSLIYDEFGNMYGQGMPIDLPERAAQSSEQLSAGFAYWGTVSYDLDNKIVTHHVKGSAIRPQWVGGDNIRHFEFVDDTLQLSLKDAEGRITGTLTWRRLK
jgi:hypothetical protein